MKQINFYGMSLLQNVPIVDKQEMIKVYSSQSIIVIIIMRIISYSYVQE